MNRDYEAPFEPVLEPAASPNLLPPEPPLQGPPVDGEGDLPLAPSLPEEANPDPSLQTGLTPQETRPQPQDLAPQEPDPEPTMQAGVTPTQNLPTPTLVEPLEQPPAPLVEHVAAATEGLSNGVALGHPAVAIVIDDLGYKDEAGKRIVAWDVPVTLAILPYVRNTEDLIVAARARGHGVLLHLPMEPDGSEDPGPTPLLTSLSPDELRARVEWNFSRLSDFDGVNNHMGSRFTRDPDALRVVFGEIARRGLFFLDSFTSPHSVGYALGQEMGLPVLKRDVFLDTAQTATSVAARLAELEGLARANGYAVAIGHPHDVTLDVIESWIPHARATGLRFITAAELMRELNSKHVALLAPPGG
jgi:polysaccharide deacetylase 2 family uncharacterized protein YibQ